MLLKSYLCDTPLSLAEDGTFRPLWSADVLEELRRNLIKLGINPEAVDRRIGQMTAFFPDAQVTGYEGLVPEMTNHPKDRHVLAAAITAGAEVPVTENVHDFPATATEPHDIVVLHQDEFLLSQLESYPRAVLDALRRQASRYKREPRTVEDLLTVLSQPGHGCPRFTEHCRQLL